MIEILLATYNGEKYVNLLLDSLLNQTYKEWQLLIRDDGSKDGTQKIIENYKKKDKRIKILKDELGNLGVVKNFEILLKNSEKNYIVLCDQDDVWEKKKLEIMFQNLQKYDLVIHDATIINEFEKSSGNLSAYVDYKRGRIKRFFKPNYIGCCMAFRKKILKKALPFPIGIAHDTWIGLICNFYYKTIFINEKLIKYRRHSNNVSNVASQNKIRIKEKIFFIRKHLKELGKRILIKNL